MIGQTISHYRIVEKLGEGGMGEVYLAEDTSLHRKVALKFLPLHLQQDVTALRRFQREAHSAAALDHPFICKIYEVSQTDDELDFIVMEYVEGLTLQDRLSDGPLPMKQALRIAIEVAEALEKAHTAGIVHRDLKPSNIMITAGGHIKVMDFGLAKKVVQEERTEQDISSALTREGATLGTLAYMSPEQIRARPLDQRSDIFSFGIVLYEMLTGVHPFRKGGLGETTAAILADEAPPLSRYMEDVPELLEYTLHKMLARDPAQRYQTVHEVHTDLEQVRETSGPRSGAFTGRGRPEPFHPRSLWLVVGLTTVVLLVVAATLYWRWLDKTGGRERVGQVLEARPLTTYPGEETYPALSPQGDRIAFQRCGPEMPNCDIYLQQVGLGESHRLTTDPLIDAGPSWSPDGQEIAFIRAIHPAGAGSTATHAILLMPALGGVKRTLTEYKTRHKPSDFGTSGLSWSPDGKSLAVSFRPDGEEEARVFRLTIDTRELTPLTFPPAGIYGDYWGQFSPDGRSLAFFRRTTYRTYDLYLLDLGSGESDRLTFDDFPSAAGLSWLPDGREIIFCAGPEKYESLWIVGLSGDAPVPLMSSGSSVQRTFPTFALKGDRLAYEERTPGSGDIWKIPNPSVNSSQEVQNPLISSTRDDMSPSPSPDGRRIAFVSNRSGHHEIWLCNSDGSQPRPLTHFNAYLGAPSWSPDSKKISFAAHLEQGTDLYTVDAEGGAPIPLTRHPAGDEYASWSRDGHWIYFTSNRSGEWQIWRVPAEGGEAIQITHNGGYKCLESSDGYLYYTAGQSGEIRRIPVTGGEETPVLQMELRWHVWNLSADGIYFLNREQVPPKVHRLDLQSLETREILALEIRRVSELAVSPDGQWFYVVSSTPPGLRDIMLVENFR